MSNETPKTAPKTLTIEEAGALYFGLCRASSYAAVRRGEIPIVKIGRLLRVPVVAMERMLEQAGQKPTSAEASRK